MNIGNNNHIVSKLVDSPDNILWELVENNLSIDNLTKDQKYTLLLAYGENWRTKVNELLNKSVI